MAVAGLKGSIDGKFITSFGTRGQSKADQAKKLSESLRGDATESAISTSLREGARTFGVAIQALNVTISVVNIAGQQLEKLGDVVGEMEKLARKVQREPSASQNRSQLISKFASFKTEFDDLVASSKFDGKDYLTPEGITELFKVSGLDGEGSGAIKRVITAFGDLSGRASNRSEVGLQSETVDSPLTIPSEKFVQALSQAAAIGPDSDEGNLAATQLADQLKGLQSNIEAAKESLEQSTEVIKLNIDLVRAAGFAFLDVSDKITTAAKADEVARMVRDQILENAPQALAQAGNLEAITVAALTFEKTQAESAQNA